MKMVFRSVHYSGRNIFSFKGRASRQEYICFQGLMLVFIWLIVPAMAALMSQLNAEHLVATLVGLVVGLAMIFVVLVMVPISLSLLVRRLHDLNKSGYYAFLAFTPTILAMSIPYDLPGADVIAGGLTVLSCLITFALMLIAGTDGHNRFGQDPRAKNSPYGVALRGAAEAETLIGGLPVAMFQAKALKVMEDDGLLGAYEDALNAQNYGAVYDLLTSTGCPEDQAQAFVETLER